MNDSLGSSHPHPTYWTLLRHGLASACLLVTAAATSFAAYNGGISADASRRVVEKQVRAYLNSYADDIPSNQNNGENIFVGISFKNYGQTPALNIKPSFLVHQERLPTDEIQRHLSEHQGRFHLGTNQPFGYQIPINLTAGQYHQLALAGAQLYVYASVRYEDVFERKHFAHFCFRLRAQTTAARLVPCGYYDEAD